MKEKSNDYDQLLYADSWLNEQENQTTESKEYDDWNDDVPPYTRYRLVIDDYNALYDLFFDKYGREPEKGEEPEMDKLYEQYLWFNKYFAEESESGKPTIHHDLKGLMGWK